MLPPRHLNVARSIFDRSRDLIEGWFYPNGSADGWWCCPYGCEGGGAVGFSQETILRNTLGLKSIVGSLGSVTGIAGSGTGSSVIRATTARTRQRWRYLVSRV